MTISVRGSFLGADYPATGSILHAGSHIDLVAPGHAFDTAGVSPISARIARCWLALPHARVSAFLGVVGLSEAGRNRWNRWPETEGDDIFVSAVTPPHRRCLIPEIVATTQPPADFAGWVRMRARWLRGERDLRGRGLELPARPGQRKALMERLLCGPDMLGAWAFLAARILAEWQAGWTKSGGWIPDRQNPEKKAALISRRAAHEPVCALAQTQQGFDMPSTDSPKSDQ